MHDNETYAYRVLNWNNIQTVDKHTWLYKSNDCIKKYDVLVFQVPLSGEHIRVGSTNSIYEREFSLQLNSFNVR